MIHIWLGYAMALFWDLVNLFFECQKGSSDTLVDFLFSCLGENNFSPYIYSIFIMSNYYIGLSKPIYCVETSRADIGKAECTDGWCALGHECGALRRLLFSYPMKMEMTPFCMYVLFQHNISKLLVYYQYYFILLVEENSTREW